MVRVLVRTTSPIPAPGPFIWKDTWKCFGCAYRDTDAPIRQEGFNIPVGSDTSSISGGIIEQDDIGGDSLQDWLNAMGNNWRARILQLGQTGRTTRWEESATANWLRNQSWSFILIPFIWTAACSRPRVSWQEDLSYLFNMDRGRDQTPDSPGAQIILVWSQLRDAMR